MTTSPPRLAVLGTGSIGMRHLRVFGQLLQVPVAAIPVRAARKPELLAQGFVIFETLEAAVEAGACLVVVATDTGRHLRDASKAISLNCDVLVEKPLAASTAHLAELALLAQEKERRIFLGCGLRFDRSLLFFRECLPEIGRVHTVRIECQSYLPGWRPDRDYRQSYAARAGEGGVMLDLVHEIDYAVWLFGMPSAVFARLENTGRLSIQAEESADLCWGLPGGATLSIHLDYLTHRSHRTLHAYGEFGEMEWNGVAQTVTRWLADREPHAETLLSARDDVLREQGAAFLRGAAGNDAGTLATFEDGAAVMGICDAARCSARSGCLETVVDWRTAA